jgi:hypothetical protein
VQSEPLRARTLGLTTSHRVPNPKSKYDVDVYMASLLEVKAWDFVLEVGSSKKLDPTLDANFEIFFCIK